MHVIQLTTGDVLILLKTVTAIPYGEIFSDQYPCLASYRGPSYSGSRMTRALKIMQVDISSQRLSHNLVDGQDILKTLELGLVIAAYSAVVAPT